MWTPATRRQHSRERLRYGSDLTDAEWKILEPLMPPPAKTGRPRAWSMREVLNAIFYVLRGGCAWHNSSAETFLYAASVMLLARRLAQS
jgi:transposase